MSTAVSDTASVGDVLRNFNFSVYITTAFVSNAGTFMQGVGVPFVMYELTKSNTWVGASVFAVMIPSLLMGPIVGPLADRRDRKVILLWSSVVQLIAATALWVLAINDALTPWRIISCLVVAGFGAGFQNATAHALVPLLVPQNQLMAAIRLNSVNFNVARVIGPVAGSLVLSHWGYRSTFALNALSFVVVIGGLLVTRPRQIVYAGAHEAWLRAFKTSIDYVRSRQSMRQLMLFSFMLSVFGASVWQLTAGLVAEDYHASESGIGYLIASFGVGASLCGFLLLARGHRFRRSRMTLTGVSCYALGALIAVATSHIEVGLIGFAVMGAAHSLGGVASTSTLQTQVSEEFRGRVLALFIMSSFAGIPLGSIAGGRLGDLFGLRPTLASYAVALTLYAVYGIVRLDRLRLFDKS
ncbi:MAG: MFS transporter [Actinobacteria bacterium]|jgi:MFS family permease|nr:MAG: MFS transporter [Actinomycetota bacterium]